MVERGRYAAIVIIVLMLSLGPVSNIGILAEGVNDDGRGPTDPGDAGEWRDDFSNASRIRATPGINVSDGNLSLSLQRGRGGLVEYDPYPTVMIFDNNDLKFYKPNSNRTDYLPMEMIDVFRTTTAKYCDLDLDGDIDMLLQQGAAYPDAPKIVICRGTGPESWDLEHETSLETNGITAFDLGDFNGDGWPDIAYSARGKPNEGSGIFLNRGHGIIASKPDILLPVQDAINIATGDMNSDGYDDILLLWSVYPDSRILCFFGGPDGPDMTPDIEFEADMNVTGVKVFDIDQDSHLDLLTSGAFKTYLGGPGGPDNVTDAEFSEKLNSYTIGEIDNDGHYDLVTNEGGTVRIFNGSAQGWNETMFHEITGPGLGGAMTVIDIDKDGFDDILLANETKFKVIYGEEAGWPTAPGLSLDVSSVGVPGSITAVVHRSTSKGHSGSFITEPITLPPGMKWDILDLTGAMPVDTNVSITLLNGTMEPIPGHTNLTDWNLDLSNLSDERTLHVKVHIASRLGVSTPLLDRLLVNWMDEREWREQFYGDAKITELQTLAVTGGELLRPVPIGGQSDGRYLSKVVGPDDPDAAGAFHTLRCTARLGPVQSATLQLLDATDLEVLAQLPLVDGSNELTLEDLFRLRYHPQILVQVEAGGLDQPGDLSIDDIWLNWTERRYLPPRIVDSGLSSTSVHRTETVDLWIEVTDEYDLSDVLTLTVEHRLEGEVEWSTTMLGSTSFQDGLWTTPVAPSIDATTGVYRFRVNVTDTEGNHTGAIELPASLEVLSHLPGVPLQLVATAGDARVDLGWSAPLDAGAGVVLSYRLYRGSSETSLDPLATLDGSVLSFEDLDVTNGETYYYSLRANNAMGDGPLSDVANATPRALPGVPTSLVLEAGDGNVSLSWAAPIDDGGSDVLRYSIFRGTSEDALSPLTQVNGTTHVDAGLTNGQIYYYAVAAENGVGLGARAPVLQAKPRGPPAAPGAPVPEVGDATVSLVWSAPLDTGGAVITAYRLYRGDVSDSLVLLDEQEQGDTSFTDSTVTPGSTYFYGVSAINAIGEGPVSRIVQVLAIGRPGVPTGLVAKGQDGKVRLSWEAPSSNGGTDITEYIILRGTSDANLAEVDRVGSDLVYEDVNVKRGTTYHYCIVAINALGQGDRCDAVKVTLKEQTEDGPAVAPDYLVAASMLLLAGVGAVVVSTESFKFWWGLSVVPMFTRIRKDGVLDNKTRLAIHGLVVENPGMHYSAILREFELSNGSAAYHLDVLERENFVRSIRDGRLKRFFSTETKVTKEHGLTPEEMREAIWGLVGRKPGISQKEIVYELGTSRDSTGYFLREMVSTGNLEASRKGKYTVYRQARRKHLR